MRDGKVSGSSRAGGRKGAFSRLFRLFTLLFIFTGFCALQADAQSTNQSLLDQLLQSSSQQNGGLGSLLNQYAPNGQAPGAAGQYLQPYTTPQQGAGQSQGQGPQSNSQNGTLLPVSRLEQIMSDRAGIRLRQFGYDQFGVSAQIPVPQSGALQDSYILGPGDEIVISLRGQENSEFRTTVNRDGQVILPRLSPILAAGRTLGDFRHDVMDAIHRAYISTQAFVTLGQLRQVSVVVVGEVNNPGLRLVNGLSTASDAILLSGGVKKTGSLRGIRIVRHGQVVPVDLYSYLTDRGVTRSVQLTDGDRIIVPPLGATVAVAGLVRRPGIYELAPGSKAISVRSALQLSGGTEVRGRYRMTVIHIGANGGTELLPVTEGGMIRDSEVLFVQPQASKIESQATLSGGTPLAGNYSVGKSTSLSDLLKEPGALGNNPYSLFGIIARRDPSTLLRGMIAFTPAAVVNGRENLQLQTDDIVRVVSMRESRLLSAVVRAFQERRTSAEELARAPTAADNPSASTTQSNTASQSNSSQLLTGNQATDSGLLESTPWFLRQNGGLKDERQDVAELSTMVLGDGGVLVNPQTTDQSGGQQASPAKTPAVQPNQQQQNLSPEAVPDMLMAQNYEDQELRPGQVASNREAMTFGDFAKQLKVDPLVLMHFLMDHQATIGGAVRGAGDYLIGPGVDLQALVAAAGGTSGWADESGVEVISTSIDASIGTSHTTRQLLPLRQSMLSTYVVKPHDEIRFSEVYATVGNGSVNLQGEVRSPGNYKIEKGERLSELLLRAGGLTDVAYPYGTVFLRKSVAAIEQEGYKRAADEMQNMLLASGTALGSRPVSDAGVAALISELRNAKPLGRISIIADPVQLVANSQKDPLLEPGDVIYIPQRPSTVTILGQVLQPGTVPYSPKMTPSDYVDRVGGYNDFADRSLAFVVLPDGTARKLSSGWFNLDQTDIPPGSTIVVPRDLSPVSIRQVLVDVTSIFSQVAVSLATLVVLSNNT
jgi:protein involved in polysaccharide export with SLBB domain